MDQVPSRTQKYCLGCFYMLYGLEKDICPECGRCYDRNNPATYSTRPRFDRKRLGRWSMVLAGLGTLIAMAFSISGMHGFDSPYMLVLGGGALATFAIGILFGIIGLWQKAQRRRTAGTGIAFNFIMPLFGIWALGWIYILGYGLVNSWMPGRTVAGLGANARAVVQLEIRGCGGGTAVELIFDGNSPGNVGITPVAVASGPAPGFNAIPNNLMSWPADKLATVDSVLHDFRMPKASSRISTNNYIARVTWYENGKIVDDEFHTTSDSRDINANDFFSLFAHRYD